MENKQMLKKYINALEEQNRLLKENIGVDEPLEDTLPKGVVESNDEDGPVKEEESFDEENTMEQDDIVETDKDKMVEILEALTKRVEDLENTTMKEQDEEVIEEECSDKKEESLDNVSSVDDAKDNGLVTTTNVDKNANPEEPEDSGKQNKDGDKDKIIKNESVDGEEPSENPLENEDSKKEQDEETEEETEEEPIPPVVEKLKIDKVKNESTFNKNALREALKKTKLM